MTAKGKAKPKGVVDLVKQQEDNLSTMEEVLKTHEVRIYPASLNGMAFAPSDKHPIMRFGVAVTKDAFDGNLGEIDKWLMAIVFYRKKGG
jgi:hypothetical protein